jgi:hypothetical protein
MSNNGSADLEACWCCGQLGAPADLVQLGEHREVQVCLRCAHFLHQQARAREDAQSRSAMARARDGMRGLRQVVMRYGLQRKPLIGPLLRWLGPRLP